MKFLLQRLLVVGLAQILFSSILAEEPALVPKPLKVEMGPGTFVLGATSRILVEKGNADARNVATQLAAILAPSTGFKLIVEEVAQPAARGAILFTSKGANAGLGREGYTLTSTAEGVVVSAQEGAGLFYGMQTLLQLLPPQVFSPEAVKEKVAWTIPVVKIEDQPRFPWRGLMLDVSRHFFNKEEVKNFLDLMAQHKLNTFHWHLVDDQGWRIEIKKYPKLTQIGAWRSSIAFGLDPKAATAYNAEGRYGGFYTQADIREIVAYAKTKYITIVPEIEMPGHSNGALAAYPDLSCTGGPYTSDIAAGVNAAVYCAGKEETFEFLQNVLLEVMVLFPSKYIHIGGDEVPKQNWNKCAKCQAREQSEHLKNAHELQSYFIRRMDKFITAQGRNLIGWSEIREGGISPHAALMDWIGGGAEAAKEGHDVVMSPTSHCYFDFNQAQGGEPKAIGGFLPLKTVYGFEPVPKGLSLAQTQHVLGAQGNLWSEYFPNYAHVQYMAYPRACAMAEIGWTQREQKQWSDFETRLDTHLLRLEAQTVNYRRNPPKGFAKAIGVAEDGSGRIELQRFFEGGEIRYTLDGGDPSPHSPLYSVPFKIETAANLRVRYYKPNSPATFLAEAFLLGSLPAKVETALRSYEKHELGLAFDGDPKTFFWSNANLGKEDAITIELLVPRKLKMIKVFTGSENKPKDIIADGGVIEASSGTKKFKPVAEFKNGVAEGTFFDEEIRTIRIRPKAGQENWLIVREITIQ